MEKGRRNTGGRGKVEEGVNEEEDIFLCSCLAAELHLIQTAQTVLSSERVRAYNLPS